MSITDVFIIAALILFVPVLVKHYLGRMGFSQSIWIILTFGGVAWIFIACGISYIQRLVGIMGTDAYIFETWALERVGEALREHNYRAILAGLISPGRGFYMTYQGLLYFYTGATVYSVFSINAFMAFWGGLTLTRLIYSSSPFLPSRKIILPVFLIFIPSVFFWSSDNLKEAFMYWSICQVFAFIEPVRYRKKNIQRLLLPSAGMVLGLFLRPHIILMWVMAVALGKILEPRYIKYSFIILLLIPPAYGQINKRINVRSLSQVMQKAEHQMDIYVERGNRTTFDYGSSGPIPVYHGAINTLFRPFIWSVGNLRMLLSALEIWTISMGIFIMWMRMTRLEVRCMLQNPLVRVSILVSIPFFFYFTYTVNEGLIARQRVQMYPALLALLVTPLLHRRFLRKVKRYGKDQAFVNRILSKRPYLPSPIRSLVFSR